MDYNEKLMRLMDALDHPDRYTQTELDEMLRDDETRACYELWCAAASARHFAVAPETLSQTELDEQWRQLTGSPTETASGPVIAPRRRYRVAAAMVSILLVSAVAWAAIHIVGVTRTSRSADATPPTTANAVGTDSLKPASTDSVDTVEAREETSAVQFDNATLLDIVREMGTYYHLRTACHNDGAAALRLRFLWERSRPVEKAVETLNTFEHVSLSLADSTITIQ